MALPPPSACTGDLQQECVPDFTGHLSSQTCYAVADPVATVFAQIGSDEDNPACQGQVNFAQTFNAAYAQAAQPACDNGCMDEVVQVGVALCNATSPTSLDLDHRVTCAYDCAIEVDDYPLWCYPALSDISNLLFAPSMLFQQEVDCPVYAGYGCCLGTMSTYLIKELDVAKAAQSSQGDITAASDTEVELFITQAVVAYIALSCNDEVSFQPCLSFDGCNPQFDALGDECSAAASALVPTPLYLLAVLTQPKGNGTELAAIEIAEEELQEALSAVCEIPCCMQDFITAFTFQNCTSFHSSPLVFFNADTLCAQNSQGQMCLAESTKFASQFNAMSAALNQVVGDNPSASGLAASQDQIVSNTTQLLLTEPSTCASVKSLGCCWPTLVDVSLSEAWFTASSEGLPADALQAEGESLELLYLISTQLACECSDAGSGACIFELCNTQACQYSFDLVTNDLARTCQDGTLPGVTCTLAVDDTSSPPYELKACSETSSKEGNLSTAVIVGLVVAAAVVGVALGMVAVWRLVVWRQRRKETAMRMIYARARSSSFGSSRMGHLADLAVQATSFRSDDGLL